MKLEHEPVVELERYYVYQDVREDCEFLEEAGYHPRIHEEPADTLTGVPLFVLQSPASEHGSAYDTLIRRWEEQARSEYEAYDDE